MKRILIIILTLTLISLVYFVYQYCWLTQTKELPYVNLTHLGSGSCYVNFKVQKYDSIFTVIMPNTVASELVKGKSNFLYNIYPLYMKEIIARGIPIQLNESLFSSISMYIVNPVYVDKFKDQYLTGDTTIFRNHNFLRYDLSQDAHNAIVYLYLTNGFNCCINDYSGATMVSGSKVQ